MSTVSAQHPAVVLRSSYQLVRTLLGIATIAIIGLTVAVVVLAVNNGANRSVSPVARANPSAVAPSAAADLGAKLDHSGRSATVTQTTDRLANYPDAPPPSASTPQPSVSYYLDAPQP